MNQNSDPARLMMRKYCCMTRTTFSSRPASTASMKPWSTLIGQYVTALIAMCDELSMPDWSDSRSWCAAVKATGEDDCASSIRAESWIMQDDSNGGSGLERSGAS